MTRQAVADTGSSGRRPSRVDSDYTACGGTGLAHRLGVSLCDGGRARPRPLGGGLLIRVQPFILSRLVSPSEAFCGFFSFTRSNRAALSLMVPRCSAPNRVPIPETNGQH